MDKNIPSTVKVLDIPLFNGSIQDATKSLIQIVKEGIKNNYCISATGAHGLVTANNDLIFKDTLKNFYLNLPDGMPGVWIGKLKGAKHINRCYGPDFFLDVIQKTSQEEINHYFCGGKEGVAASLKEVCENKFHNKNIVGVNCPPFKELSDNEIKSLADEINKSNADILWIGISTPKQEKFAKRLSQFTKVHFLITVGAAFDFHIGNVKQAPNYLQKMGLEWLFRLYTEPKRLWKRYSNIVPMFIYLNMKEFFGFKSSKL